jgi:hypothetical protein
MRCSASFHACGKWGSVSPSQTTARLPYLDDLLVGLIINLNCSDCLFHLSQDHIQMLIIGLQRTRYFSADILQLQELF